MEIWREESNTIKYFILSFSFFVVGGVLMFGFRHFDTSQFTDSLGGFLLGVLLFILAIGLFFVPYKEVTIIDPVARNISIHSTTLFGEKEEVIPADTIENARVSYFGKASQVIGNTYYISLLMRDGSRHHLFLSGYYNGRGSESAVEEKCLRLGEYLGIQCSD